MFHALVLETAVAERRGSSTMVLVLVFGANNHVVFIALCRPLVDGFAARTQTYIIKLEFC